MCINSVSPREGRFLSFGWGLFGCLVGMDRFLVEILIPEVLLVSVSTRFFSRVNPFFQISHVFSCAGLSDGSILW